LQKKKKKLSLTTIIDDRFFGHWYKPDLKPSLTWFFKGYWIKKRLDFYPALLLSISTQIISKQLII
jgi:hypothetical protein